MDRIYLDHTATTPLDTEVFDAMKPFFFEKYGNASSIHSFGREARAALDESRDKIARAIGASAGEIFFVSSGTEADNFAIKGVAWKMRELGKNQIITSKVEHHAVLEPCEFLSKHGFEITYLNVDEYGMVHPESLQDAITERTGLISIMHANNEVGTINPIVQLANIAQEYGIVFHTDAVQTLGKLPLHFKENSIDLASFSAHKIYGPKGIGAIYIKKGTKLENLMHGGGQERGRRAGTENIPLAVGFAKATELLQKNYTEEANRLSYLNKMMVELLKKKFPFIIFNGHPTDSLSHIINISFDSKQIELDGEALLFNLDMAGVAVTSGSACTSGSIEPSHVLLAMGRDSKTAKATIRFSMGKSTREEQVERVVEVLGEVVNKSFRFHDSSFS